MFTAAVKEFLLDGLGGGVDGAHAHADQVVHVELAPGLHFLPKGGREHGSPIIERYWAICWEFVGNSLDWRRELKAC